MRKLSALTTFLLTPLLLASCWYTPGVKVDKIFEREKIEGTGMFTELTLNLDRNTETVKVSFDGFESSPSGLKQLSSRTELESEVVNEIGIKSKYEAEYYFYKVELSQSETTLVAGKLHDKITQETEGKDFESASFIRETDVVGVGFYIKRSLYEGKLRTNMEDFYAGVLLNHKDQFYDGNGLYETIYFK